MSERYLILFDADHIKDYVYATGRLKGIRGASEQVRRLTGADGIRALCEEALQHPLDEQELIYADGGAGALLVTGQAEAERLCAVLEQTYRHKTRRATLSVVMVPVDDDPAAAQSRAARMLRQRKSSRIQAGAPPSGGYLRFCSADRIYPATASDPADPSALLSAPSLITHTLSRRYRENLIGSPFWQRFSQLINDSAQQKAWEALIESTQDLNTIGELSRPQGYVAMVYADGDGIGDLIQRVVQHKGFEGYRRLSQALSQAAVEATASALHSAYQSFSGPSLPFEVITIGGDDVLLICTAERGLEVACALSKIFSEQMTAFLQNEPGLAGQPVTASVGVVIAHASQPIVTMQRRAGELLKSAKRGKVAGASEGCLDFHIVNTPGMEPISDVRSSHYTLLRSNDSLTARPYSLSLAEKLLAQAGNLRAIPGSKRVQLYEACMRAPDRIVATLEVLRIQMRLGLQRDLLLAALRELDVSIIYPFMEKRDREARARVVTPLIDLLEVAEFVGQGDHL